MALARIKKSVVVIGAISLVTCVAGPASANDASITLGSARASYTDLTDNLCAKENAELGGLEDFAKAQIINISTGAVVFSVTDPEGGGQTCTGNLSIPEDKEYFLRVTDCTIISSGSDCGTAQKRFFS